MIDSQHIIATKAISKNQIVTQTFYSKLKRFISHAASAFTPKYWNILNKHWK